MANAKRKKRIGILTSGGDCPGLNAVIRAVAKKAMREDGAEIIGIEDGFEGLVTNKHRILHPAELSGILTIGGTILGTTKKVDPFHYAIRKGKTITFKDMSRTALRNVDRLGLDCLVVIGGDGSQGLGYKFLQKGVPIIGIPKTIDNDIVGTDITFGFNSAVTIAAEGIDRLHTTAQSHHRVMVIEVMGHNAGWIALHAGIAGGGDIILVPEIPYSMGSIIRKVYDRSRKGKRFSIVVVAEGAKPKGGNVVIQRLVKESSDPVRLGGVGFVVADQIEKATDIETRTVVMGHLQRGGSPTPFDRVLATQFGTRAVDLIRARAFGHMVGILNMSLVNVPLIEVAGKIRNIQPDNPLIASARSVETCFGDDL